MPSANTVIVKVASLGSIPLSSQSETVVEKLFSGLSVSYIHPLYRIIAESGSPWTVGNVVITH